MSWFKNILIYRLKKPIDLTADELQTQLLSSPYTPCNSQDSSKTGWIPIIGGSESLVHVSGKHYLLRIQKEEKMVPPAVIKRKLTEKTEKLEFEQQRKLKKTEKESLKDEILHDLLPHAFSRYNQTDIWIDLSNQRIIVNSSSSKRAEDALALLRKNLGTLPVVPLTLKTPIEITLTEWLSHLPESHFTLGEEAELKATEQENGVIQCKYQDLMSEEISNHITSGKQVTKLALAWRENIQFIVTEAASLKRLKYSDKLLENNDDISHEDKAQRIDADFTLMTGELSELITDLIAALGGEAE